MLRFAHTWSLRSTRSGRPEYISVVVATTCAIVSGSPQEHAVGRRQRFGTGYRGNVI